jgi:hypothetical protein
MGFITCDLYRSRPGPKIIKLKLETRLKSQASEWLKWQPGRHYSQSDVWELRLVSKLSFMILGPAGTSVPSDMDLHYSFLSHKVNNLMTPQANSVDPDQMAEMCQQIWLYTVSLHKKVVSVE